MGPPIDGAIAKGSVSKASMGSERRSASTSEGRRRRAATEWCARACDCGRRRGWTISSEEVLLVGAEDGEGLAERGSTFSVEDVSFFWRVLVFLRCDFDADLHLVVEWNVYCNKFSDLSCVYIIGKI